MSKKIVTGKVRGSYVNVFASRMNDMSGKEEYSMSILIPKEDKETVARIRAVVAEVTKEKWGGKVPGNLRQTLRDGDSERPDDPAYAGHYWLNLKSKDRPGIIDKARKEVTDPREFVSGDYCRVSMSAYAYDFNGNRGVAFGLGNIQVLGRGEPLSGRARAEDEFDDFEEDDAGDDLF